MVYIIVPYHKLSLYSIFIYFFVRMLSPKAMEKCAAYYECPAAAFCEKGKCVCNVDLAEQHRKYCRRL